MSVLAENPRGFSAERNAKRRGFFPSTISRLALGAMLVLLASDRRGDAASWVTGAALQRQLASPVDIVFGDSPLRQSLSDLSRSQNVAIVTDRRIDPDQRLHVRLTGVPLSEALEEIARERRLGIAQLGPVAYLGPPEPASRIRTLAALRETEARRLGNKAARRFLARASMRWGDFATPRELLAQLAKQAGITIDGLDRVPHDLWAAADLPPMTWIDRVTLIANQFDLTFAIRDADRIELVAVPNRAAIVRDYPGGADPKATAERLGALLPNAEVKVVDQRVSVRARLEDHLRITSAGRSSPATSKPGPAATAAASVRISRFAVKDQPLASVLEQLAKKLRFELRLDREALQKAGVSPDHRVSAELENTTLDAILRELLRDTSLDFRHTGNVVEIIPRRQVSD